MSSTQSLGSAVLSGPNELHHRVNQMRRREELVYHRGSLASDRIMRTSEDYEPALVGKIAAAAYRLFEDGIVTLVQRKLREGVYEYLAVRR